MWNSCINSLYVEWFQVFIKCETVASVQYLDLRTIITGSVDREVYFLDYFINVNPSQERLCRLSL